jgi:hypothetical protein
VAAVRVLTVAELNRALLARQLLLRRERLSVTRAIERVGALQAQWPPSPYLALWSRLESFRRENLTRAVESRRVVKATLMRATLHLVTARDYLAYAGLLLEKRVAWAEGQLAQHPGNTDIERLVRELVAHAGERPRTRPELLELLGQPKLVIDERRPSLVWHLLAAKAALVHGPSSSRWRMHTAGGTHVPAATWLGSEGAGGIDAAVHLLRRYLAAFGPATRADIAHWTGLPIGTIEPALTQLQLRRFRDERERELVDLPRAPLPPASTPAPPRFLPRWDSVLLAHNDRSRILPDAYRKSAIQQGGDVLSTFLVDGLVAGTWHIEDGRVRLEPFERVGRETRRELEREGRALQEFHRMVDR